MPIRRSQKDGTELRRDEEVRRARARDGANAPPRSRYQQASAAGHTSLRTASPNFPQMRLAATQCREPLSTFTGDQSFQPGVNDSGLLGDTAEPCRLFEQFVVNVQCRPHMHKYARFMHTVKGSETCGHSTFPSNSSRLGVVSRKLTYSPVPPTRCWTNPVHFCLNGITGGYPRQRAIGTSAPKIARCTASGGEQKTITTATSALGCL